MGQIATGEVANDKDEILDAPAREHQGGERSRSQSDPRTAFGRLRVKRLPPLSAARWGLPNHRNAMLRLYRINGGHVSRLGKRSAARGEHDSPAQHPCSQQSRPAYCDRVTVTTISCFVAWCGLCDPCPELSSVAVTVTVVVPTDLPMIASLSSSAAVRDGM